MLEYFLHSVNITSVLIVAIFFLILEYRPQWWYRKSNDCNNIGTKLIPGPFALPGIGTKWIVYVGGYTFNKLHEYYQEMNKKYGSIMKEEYLANIPIISLFDKKDIIKVLKSGGKYPLRPPNEAVAYYRKSRPDRYATMGLVNEQGKSWHFLRTALTPVLTSPKTISDFLPTVKEIADDWCNLIKEMRDSNNKIAQIEDLVDYLGFEITCALVLGRRMDFLKPKNQPEAAKKLAHAIREHFVATRDTYYGLPFWKLFSTAAYKTLIYNEEIIYELTLDLINSSSESSKNSTVFQSVLKADIDHKEKIATIIDFIIAGIHTLKNSLVFLLHLVGEDLQVQNKILEDSAYSKACLTESFRLCPTAYSLGRIIDEDMELSGYHLKAGTVVICHTGIACHNEENFKNADKFVPERWIDEDKIQNSLNSSLVLAPFGAGRRICPGKRFIEQILPIILEYTVKHFTIKSTEPLELQFEFLLAAKGPVPMIFEDRSY